MTYGKDKRDAASDGLRAVENGLVAEEEVLPAVGGLPRDDGCAVQEDFDTLAGGQSGSDAGIVIGDGDLRGGLDGRNGNSGRLLGPLHDNDTRV